MFKLIHLVLIAGLWCVSSLADSPEVPRGKGEFCVEPTDIMRKQHMDFLFHQRDETVYNGKREQKHSLIGCIDCHVQTSDNGQHIPINEEGQFCEVCHSFVSVKIDCFECHATVPDREAAASADTKPSRSPELLTARSFSFNESQE